MGDDRAAQTPYSTARAVVRRLPGGGEEEDVVAVEEPLEIRIGGEPVAVTMRTPGHDEELALGFCLTEGLRPVSARVPDDLSANTVEVEATGFDLERLRRNFYTSSSCGVCGKGAIEAVRVAAPRVESRVTVGQDVISVAPRAPPLGADGVRRDRRPARDRSLRRGGGAALRPRGRRPPQRAGQGRRPRVPRRAASAGGARAVRQRPPLVRAGAEGVRRRVPDARGGRGAVLARRRARRGSRDDALWLRPRRPCDRLHRAVASRVAATGILLVGGASERFGSPKALASFRGETLAERGWRILGEACEEVLAVGKEADGLELPFLGPRRRRRAARSRLRRDRRSPRCVVRDLPRPPRGLPAGDARPPSLARRGSGRATDGSAARRVPDGPPARARVPRRARGAVAP